MERTLVESVGHYLLQVGAYGGAATIIATTAWAVVGFLHRTVGKRRALRRAVEQLTTSIRVAYVEKLLGPSKFRRQHGNLVEDVFVNDYCTVQALSVADGTVCRIAVTVTNNRFHPEFWLGLPGSWPHARVRLGRSKFSDVGLDCTWYASRGARRFQYWEKYYLGNPGGYQTYVLAISDGGVGPIGDLELILPENTFENGSSFTDNGSVRDATRARTPPANWIEFRDTTVVNTFAVASDEGTATSGWIGADVDVVRLLPPSRWRRRRIERRAISQIRKTAPDHPMAARGLRSRRRLRR